ncbi:MAG: ParB/RepB/Spo0J family partition protein [Thermoanaerobaculales bacterium]|jgi:ParB family chromosome partitioning protein|nr:ParB/RepB/Spo0J family partition protein [Thermoanaerobaculales bacterium]
MAAKQALGRGLKALIPDTPRARTGLAEIPVDHLVPNPEQPRHRFDEQALAELAGSIARHGVLQPLVVSEDGPERYLVITGERRWRAAQRAGLRTVPAVIRERLDSAGQLELALVENLQRRDLTPLEEARAFEQLRLSLGLTQAEIAERVAMDRSTVANALRLLKLPPAVQAAVDGGELSAGHARTLLALEDDAERCAWAERVIATGLSVRELERAVAAAREAAAEQGTRPAARPPRDPNLVAAEQRLALRIGAPVEIRSRRRGGVIVISCADQDELMRVFDLLMGGA